MAKVSGLFLRKKISALLAAIGLILARTTGHVFYVDSVAGSDSNDGAASSRAFATIAKALTVCTAAKGDLVLLMPGHAETVHTAAFITQSVSGVTIRGLGNGRNRPVLTWDATAAQIIISGANTRIENVVCDFTGIDQVVAGFSVTAADVRFTDCEFVVGSAVGNVILGILTAATATRFTVDNCRWIGTNSGTATTACIKHEVGVDFVIRDNLFKGKMVQAVLNATTILGGLIHNNIFHIYSGTKGVALAAATTCVFTNNRFLVTSGTAPIVATVGSFAGNAYSTEAIGVVAGTAGTF